MQSEEKKTKRKALEIKTIRLKKDAEWRRNGDNANEKKMKLGNDQKIK